MTTNKLFKKDGNSMIDLFTRAHSFKGNIRNVDLDRYYKQQADTIAKIVGYERTHGSRVDSGHILLQLLYSLPSVRSDDSIDFYNAATEHGNDIANALGITSGRSNGKVSNNTFYPGKNILLLDKNKLSFSEIIKVSEGGWEDLVPVKCVKLSNTFNPLSQAKGIKSTEGSDWDISVVTINVAVFALMAKLWSDANRKKVSGTRETPSIFISRYVVPNMLESQVHSAIVTDLVRTLKGEIPNRDKVRSSQWVLDYTGRIVDGLVDIVNDLPLTSLELEETLAVLPAIGKVSFLDRIPDLGDRVTQLNLWAHYPAVMDELALSYFLLHRSDSGLSEFKVRFKYQARQYTNNSAFRKAKDPKVKRILEDSLDNMLFDLA